MRGGRGYSSRGSGRGGGNSYGRQSSSYRGSHSDRSSYGGGGGTSSYRGGSASRNARYGSNYNTSSSSYDRNRDTRGRNDSRNTDHKRPYRPSSRGSPDRKRSRNEDSRLNSSHYSSSSSSYRRNDSSTGRPISSSRPVASSSYRQRDDSASRRGGGDMGPPKNIPPRSPRVSGRGVGATAGAVRPRIPTSRMRGSTRNVRIVRRREVADIRTMKRQLLLARQRDRVRRIKIAKLTSSLRRRKDGSTERRSSSDRKSYSDKKTSSKDEKKTSAPTTAGAPTTAVTSFKAEKKSTVDDGGDDEEKKDEKKKLQSDEDDDMGTTKGEDESTTEEGKEKSTAAKKTKEPKKSDDKDNEKEDKDKILKEKNVIVKEKDDRRSSITDSPSKNRMKTSKPSNFIKLTCVHCHTKCLTFKEYTNHLYGRSHKIAMRRLALRQKAQLSRMRMQQRNAQRDIEDNEETADCKSQFCLLCRLNYRQPKADHQSSDSHRKMKKFLMPYCSSCRIAFKSPMVYETHRCSLDHIKRKARNNESASSETSDIEKEVDLNNFMTVDSVGEIDGTAVDDENGDENQEDEPKEKPNIGVEHVKKIEAFYCDLCVMYLSLRGDDETLLKKHCANRSHLKAYYRFKEDEKRKALEEERRKQKEKEKEKKKEKELNKEKEENGHLNANEKEKAVKKEDAGDNNEENDDEEDTADDKLWEDVDKDLGDLLRDHLEDDQVDDEEDGSVLNIGIERFDKFKNSEKQKTELNGNIGDNNDESLEQADEEEIEDDQPKLKIPIKKELSQAVVMIKKDVDTKSKSTPNKDKEEKSAESK